jgi:hypothetical protein
MTLFAIGSFFPALAARDRVKTNSVDKLACNYRQTLLEIMKAWVILCNGNSVYIFLFWELRSLSPNFHIHVSVNDLYIHTIGPHISSSRKGRPFMGIYNSLTDT